MKIDTTAGALAKSLKVLQRVAPKSWSHLPILTMVKFADGRLTVTDLDQQLSVALPHSGFSGLGLLPFWRTKRLADAMDPDASLTIETLEQGGVLITCGSGRYVLPNMPVDDFPEFRCDGTSVPIECDLVMLRDALAFAYPTASREETRYYLNGVCLYGSDIVSTDGHRLALTKGVLRTPVDKVIIPYEAVRSVLDMPRIDRAIIRLRDSGVVHGVEFEGCGVRLVSKVINGSFPDVYRVIPSSNVNVLTVNRALLMSSLKRLAAVSDGRNGISLSFDGESLAVGSIGIERETGYEEIPASGAKLDAGFNGQYLKEVLKILDGETASVHFAEGDVGAPALLRGAASNRFVVLMPLRRDTDLLRVMSGRGILPPEEKKKAA